jgi:hypothetical protein
VKGYWIAAGNKPNSHVGIQHLFTNFWSVSTTFLKISEKQQKRQLTITINKQQTKQTTELN